MASSMSSFNLVKPDVRLEAKVEEFSGFLRTFSR